MNRTKILHKGHRRESLLKAVVSCFAIFIGGSALIMHIARVTGGAPLTGNIIRQAAVSIALLLALVVFSGIYLYRASETHSIYGRSVLYSIPTPVLLADSDAKLQYANKAARDLMGIDDNCELRNFNIKHLVNSDGDISAKVWSHNGKDFHISGIRIVEEGRNYGYLVTLDHIRMFDSNQVDIEMLKRALNEINTAKR